jgi:hypothetical protein
MPDTVNPREIAKLAPTVGLERNLGKIHHNLKAGIGWKFSDGRWYLAEPSKEGKGGRAAKEERNSGDGGGRFQPPFRVLRVNLGRAAAVHCFSGCDSGESESNLHTQQFDLR